MLTLLWAPGCKKKEPAPLTPARIHSITKELADAAASAAPGSVIKTRKTVSDNTDEVVIQYEGGQVVLTRVWRSIASVATRNRLTQDPPIPTPSSNGFLLILRHSRVPTHRIEISETPQPPTGEAKKSAQAQLAIILDDLGSDRAAADAIFALPYPLTISVLPHHEHSVEIAQEAKRRGYQVMLHLPMQSIANETPETRELHPGMPAAELASLVADFLESVPGAVGVNNHQGSQATSDAGLMSELMPVLGERHLFYVDSRTTAATVAYDTAQSFGVPSAFRNVPFLDDLAQVPAVRKQLELALRDAREKGEAIAIGHAHPATLQALREILPQGQARGVRLVFASELVH
ncbi:MAG TPA: divergent polysaccharide deacetylase family protein [Candidatus Acidoferrum sp.]|nr:divergent polysaccharide deacetylase family protein [Candidatus Acidoferrum sp.]